MSGTWGFESLVHLPLLPFCRPQSLLPAVFSTRNNLFPTRCKSQEVYQQHPTPAMTTGRYWDKQVLLSVLNFCIVSLTRFLLHQVVCLLDNVRNIPVRPFCQPCITLGQSLFQHLNIPKLNTVKKAELVKTASLHRYRLEDKNTGYSSYQSVLQVQHIEGHSAQQTGKQYEKIWHGIAICLHCPLRQYQVSLQFLG